jgi:hypothetical protein
MPYGSWINELPTSFFLAVHIAAFTIGASFAWFAFKREQPLLGVAFSLFGAAEPRRARQDAPRRARFVELEVAEADADATVPGLRAHLDGCAACREDHDGLYALAAGERPG